MEKARKEIDSIIGKDIMVLETDIDNIPSLQAIVKETLRLHPPSPFVLRESTRNCTIAGYDIPAKTQVFTNVWAIGRDPKYWDGPLEFRPKRFLSNDNESGKMGQVGFRGQHYQLLLLGVEEKESRERRRLPTYLNHDTHEHKLERELVRTPTPTRTRTRTGTSANSNSNTNSNSNGNGR
ncbi:hypothetical protein JHK85_034911 [Glycine max]|nr:hypothetical protein JHK85_034911 [Glycine max]